MEVDSEQQSLIILEIGIRISATSVYISSNRRLKIVPAGPLTAKDEAVAWGSYPAGSSI